jgi:hypothetical protein
VISIVLGAVLILTGLRRIIGPELVSIVDLLLIVGGVAICLRRWWGFWLAYAATLLGLWQLTSVPRNALAYFPFSALFAALDRFLEFPKPVTVIVGNSLFVGMLAWTHYVLQPTGQLSEPLSPIIRRRVTKFFLGLSGVVFAVPFAWFVFALIVDPPTGGRDPGGWGPGAFPMLVALFVWPIVLVGLAGIIVCCVLLWLMRRAESRRG